ncbi:MAG: tetraacyldisaccharide 4'-kinase, partial [Paludibacteraceae bacterium]|nr:tetraacyldisaccharide 4'-kinase [Paludibacteraceae bacterium]
RRTKGFVEADDKATAATIGDESMQLKRKFPNIVVAVCEDRYIGIRRLKRRHADLDVVVLDDAFQHRRIKPGLSILLTQADRLYVEDQLLPLGRLREPAEGSLRANIVVVTKCPKGMQPIDQRIIDTKLHVLPAQTLVFTRMKYLDWDAVFDPNGNKPNKPNKVLLVTGIAQPQYLVEHMQESAAAVCSLTFPDHHVFSEKDIRRIRETFELEHCDLIVTTEKDAVRLRECRSFPEELKPRVFAQPIETEFLQKDITTFNTIVLRYVRESKRNR